LKDLLIFPVHFNGDIIKYFIYVKLMSIKYPRGITFYSDKNTITLVARSLDGVTLYDSTSALRCDYWTSIFSLAARFDFAPDILPRGMTSNLDPSPGRISRWNDWIADRDSRNPTKRGLHIRVAWNGHPLHDDIFQRNASAQAYAPLMLMENAQCFSLTQDVEESLTPPNLKPHITIPGTRIADFDDLAALASNMDVVDTTCTVTVHIAGALGIPCWLLLGPTADGRWGNGTTFPLYRSAQIVRCAKLDAWDDAVNFIRATLLAKWPERLSRIAVRAFRDASLRAVNDGPDPSLDGDGPNVVPVHNAQHRRQIANIAAGKADRMRSTRIT
jgi:hypothetical protein